MRIKGLTDEQIRAGIAQVNLLYSTSIRTVEGGWNSGHNVTISHRGRFAHFALRLASSKDPFHRRSAEHPWQGYKTKVMPCVCWHGFKAVMLAWYEQNPQAIIVTGAARYNGLEGFLENHMETYYRNAGSQMMPQHYGDLCDCEYGPEWPPCPQRAESAEHTTYFEAPEPDDLPGTDDALVPESLSADDPARWAEYNRKWNALLIGGSNG